MRATANRRQHTCLADSHCVETSVPARCPPGHHHHTSSHQPQNKHQHRLKDFGPNRLTPADKPGFFRRLWNQLNNILIYILLAAAIVEGALQSWAEFGLVMGVIVVNTAIGLIQEGKAEKVRAVRLSSFIYVDKHSSFRQRQLLLMFWREWLQGMDDQAAAVCQLLTGHMAGVNRCADLLALLLLLLLLLVCVRLLTDRLRRPSSPCSAPMQW